MSVAAKPHTNSAQNRLEDDRWRRSQQSTAPHRVRATWPRSGTRMRIAFCLCHEFHLGSVSVFATTSRIARPRSVGRPTYRFNKTPVMFANVRNRCAEIGLFVEGRGAVELAPVCTTLIDCEKKRTDYWLMRTKPNGRANRNAPNALSFVQHSACKMPQS